ncbi:MAG: MBL fold metallo-hydrolase [Rhizobiaceae bacterium]|nr:MBL fold metallo-hydrolase [Rhizobiaceae bacterium]
MHCWGVRGSLPVSGPQFERYGGNTFCIEVRCGDHRLVFDAGSGLLPASRALLAEGVRGYDLFFTHCHYDHIIGLPFFLPIYVPDTRVRVWTGHLGGAMTTQEMMDSFIRPPWFPVRMDMCRSCLDFRDFNAGETLDVVPGLTMTTRPLMHPGNATGYRLEWMGKTFAIITDTEHVPGAPLDPNVLALIEDADLFLYDCMYVDDEMEKHRGFGHSTWQQAIRLARAAGARRVGFVHHSPLRTDDEIDEIGRQASEAMAGAFPVPDGAVYDLLDAGA